MPFAEVRAELGEEVARRPKVVVDDIEDDRQLSPMASIDESLHRVRPAIRMMRREQVHAVIAPATLAGELRDRHHLDGVHAQLDEMRKLLDHGVERALARERPDVELIEDRAGERLTMPSSVRPLERRVVD